MSYLFFVWQILFSLMRVVRRERRELLTRMSLFAAAAEVVAAGAIEHACLLSQVKATAERMGRAARAHVLRNFTRGAFGQRLEAIVREMVDGPSEN